MDSRLNSGDEIMYVDGQSVLNTSHHHVVQLMGSAAITGRVTLGIRRKMPTGRYFQTLPPPTPSHCLEFNMNEVSISESPNQMSKSDGVYPYDVTVTRRENEGFGFVIISAVSRAGSTIGRSSAFSFSLARCQVQIPSFEKYVYL